MAFCVVPLGVFRFIYRLIARIIAFLGFRGLIYHFFRQFRIRFPVFSCFFLPFISFFLTPTFFCESKKEKQRLILHYFIRCILTLSQKTFNISKRLLTSLRKLSTLPGKLFSPCQRAFNITSKALTLSQEEEFGRRVVLNTFDLGTFITFLRV